MSLPDGNEGTVHKTNKLALYNETTPFSYPPAYS